MENEDPDSSSSDADSPELTALLDYLDRTRGFDFSAYKRSTISRRVRRRMQMVNVKSYADYIDHLEVHPDEFPQLFNLILINVTGFFRDAAAWTAVDQHLGKMLESRADDRPIRVWSAGCASGEEAYTLAMLLAEKLGPDAFMKRVKIYATDIDEDALAHARQATYSAKSLEGVPQRFVEKYFVATGGSFVFEKDFRRAVIFGRHDLVQDAPISRVDILSCRNTLMYFNAETQTRILNRLHFALCEDGLLFLGKAEMLLTHGNIFTPLDLKLRLFGRATKGPKVRERVVPVVPVQDTPTPDVEERARLFRVAFDTAPVAQIVVDPSGKISLINQRAARLFSLTAHDVGRPFHDLELSYRPAELRSHMDAARTERRAIVLREIERTLPNGEKTYFDVEVVPLLAEGTVVAGTQVSFVEITHYQRLQGELRKANTELEAAQEELQSTSEELETTNEELQSTIEELETTNEELQSTNEELETMNEELQSTNEELQTMNEELRQRGDELNQVNAFFSAILASLRSGVAVLDRDLMIRAWNHKMEDLWGLRSDEVEGKHFLNLDIGLPIDALTGAVRACLGGEAEVERTLDCTNRRGKAVRCKVTVSPLRDPQRSGVIVIVEEVDLGA